MIRVVVGGATGKLGSLVCALVQKQEDMKLVGAVVSPGSSSLGKEIAPGVKATDQLVSAVSGADVYVDVTSPQAAAENLRKIERKDLCLVVGTTGLSEDTMRSLSGSLRRNGTSAVVTPNFSIGVNVFWKACHDLAEQLDGYEVEIIEVHHDQKKDAPSGTAKRAADIISEVTNVDKMIYGRAGNVGARGREIGIHSIRAGDVVGEHTVIFAGKKERIELTHRAHSRETFAEGCIMAVRWVAGKNDGMIHSMNEVIGI